MSAQVQKYKQENDPMQQTVRQGNVISPKLFTAPSDDDFKLLDWKGFGIGVYRPPSVCRRYRAHGKISLSIMISDLDRLSKQVGLKINMDRAKIILNVHVMPTRYRLEILLSKLLSTSTLDKMSNLLGPTSRGVNRRIQLGWAAFGA
ncbi:unnamed protein product [Euphydryas editha]|uniref:Uncharacterized protein n=1 Tax=Euphydryas editha TaxID=104508 RepID=A0AAU9UG99_EUPED|nr:unnamed protein product [Euphydryas editha]